MRVQTWVWMVLVVTRGGAVGRLHAVNIGCVSTTFRWVDFEFSHTQMDSITFMKFTF